MKICPERYEKSKEITYIVKARKLQYFGQVIRHPKHWLLKITLQRKVEEGRGPGRRRHSWIRYLRQQQKHLMQTEGH